MADADPIIGVYMGFSKHLNTSFTGGNEIEPAEKIRLALTDNANQISPDKGNIPSDADPDIVCIKESSLSDPSSNEPGTNPPEQIVMVKECMPKIESKNLLGPAESMNEAVAHQGQMSFGDIPSFPGESDQTAPLSQDDPREAAIREYIMGESNTASRESIQQEYHIGHADDVEAGLSSDAAMPTQDRNNPDLDDEDDDILHGITIDAGEGISNEPSDSGSEDSDIEEIPRDELPANMGQKHDSNRPRRIRWMMTPTPKDIKQGKEIGLQHKGRINHFTRELYPEVVSRLEKMQNRPNLRYRGSQLTTQDAQAIFPDQVREIATESGIFSNPETEEMGVRHMYKEIIDGMRADEKARSSSDQERIDAAIKSFNRPPIADGSGKWKMHGLKTSLYGHQVC